MRILILLLLSSISFAQNHLPCLQESEYKSNWTFLGPKNPESKLADQHAGVITSISVNPNDTNEIYIGTMTSGLFHSTNRGKSWTCLTDNFMYPVLGVSDIHVNYTVTPHSIFIATGSSNTWYDAPNFGILYSSNNGLSWSEAQIQDNKTFFSIEIKKIIEGKNGSPWYAYGLKEILRSKDKGLSWEIIYSPDKYPELFYNKEFQIISMEISDDEHQLFFTTRANPIFNSDQTKILLESEFIEIKDCHKSITSSQFIKHTQELKNLYENKISNPTYALKLSRDQENTLWVDRTFVNTREHAIYNYEIETNQLIKINTPNNKYLPEDIYWRKGLIQHKTNPAIQYFCGNLFYKSIDSGNTFQPMYGYSYGYDNVPHADIRSILITHFSKSSLDDEIYLGTDGGLSYSSDGGRTFRNLNGTSLQITQFFGVGSSPFSGAISAGSQDNSIMTYLPTSKEWVHDVRGDGYDVEYSKALPGEAFGQYNSRYMMRTLNDKAPFDVNAFIEPKEAASNKKTIVTHKNGNCYFAEFQFHILRKGTTTWEHYPTGSPHPSLAFAVSESDANIVYLSGYWNKLFKSIDGGKTFKDISSNVKIGDRVLSDTRIHAICISPTNPEKVWISLGYFGDYYNPCNTSERVLYSPDGGTSWINFTEGLPAYYVTDIVYLDGSDDALMASTFEGIFFRKSLTDTWKLFSTDFPKTIVTELNINYCRGKLIAATYGRGLWETDLPSINYSNPIVIKKNTVFETSLPTEAMPISTDIVIKKNKTLTINCAVHIAKGKSIWLKNINQLVLGTNGRILTECGEKWNGIKIK